MKYRKQKVDKVLLMKIGLCMEATHINIWDAMRKRGKALFPPCHQNTQR